MGENSKKDDSVPSDLNLESTSTIVIANPSISHIGKKYITELALIAEGININMQSENDFPKYLNSSF